jgi:hypothetical protein
MPGGDRREPYRVRISVWRRTLGRNPGSPAYGAPRTLREFGRETARRARRLRALCKRRPAQMQTDTHCHPSCRGDDLGHGSVSVRSPRIRATDGRSASSARTAARVSGGWRERVSAGRSRAIRWLDRRQGAVPARTGAGAVGAPPAVGERGAGAACSSRAREDHCRHREELDQRPGAVRRAARALSARGLARWRHVGRQKRTTVGITPAGLATVRPLQTAAREAARAADGTSEPAAL